MRIGTEQILKAILDYSPQNIVLIDANYKVITCNERMRHTLFSYHKHYLEPGDDYRDFVIEATMQAFLTAFAKALQGDITEVELLTEGADFTSWFYYRVNPVYVDGSLLGVALSAEDITERKLAEKELQESEANFRALVEQSLLGVFISLQEKVVYGNPAFARMLCGDNEKLLGEYTFADFIHADDIALFRESCRDVIEGKREMAHLVVTAISTNTEVRSFEVNLSRIFYKDQVALLATALDITDIIDEDIRINEAVYFAQEAERVQLGMELHDNVKQQLVATTIQLKRCLRSIPEAFKERVILEEGIINLRHAVNDLRQLSHRLAPLVGDETSIVQKITALIDRMHLDDAWQIEVEVEDSCNVIEATVQHVIYRVIQEQLNNIISYANTFRAKISIFRESNKLMVIIKDDGVGFDMTKKSTGIGLQNIRKRLQVLRGNASIQSSPGAGFTLTASIPL